MFFDELSNNEWARLAELVADEPQNRRGRPRAEPRTVANAVLWVMTTGEPWSRLPAGYPSVPTCRHRFEAWLIAGTLTQMINVLSGFGRTFVCIPQAPVARVARSDRLRGVAWKRPELWQTSTAHTGVFRPADAISAMTRQLSGPADPVPRESPVFARANQDTPGQPDSRRGAWWTHRAWSGARIAEYRGHTIYVSTQPVQQLMYRACTAIEKDGMRIERSGLIGPRFADTEAAERYALDWARQWIDRDCATLAARAKSMAVRNVPTAMIPRPTNTAIRRLAQERCDPVTDRRSDGAPSSLHDASAALKQVG
jgi:transposase